MYMLAANRREIRLFYPLKKCGLHSPEYSSISHAKLFAAMNILRFVPGMRALHVTCLQCQPKYHYSGVARDSVLHALSFAIYPYSFCTFPFVHARRFFASTPATTDCGPLRIFSYSRIGRCLGVSCTISRCVSNESVGWERFYLT